MTAGIITLVAGFISFCIGAVALGRFCWLSIRNSPSGRAGIWLKALLSAGLLVINFPVAGVILNRVVVIKTRYTVQIRNDSSQPLHEVRVYGGGVEERFGTVGTAAAQRRDFWIQQDGELMLEMKLGPTLVQTNIDGYVTQNLGGDVRVTVNADSSISIKRRRD